MEVGVRRELLHIWGPFSIYSYGVAIAIGVLLLKWLIQKDPRFAKLRLEQTFTGFLVLSILVALLGGRLLYLVTEPDGLTEWSDLVDFWQGGFSLLGSILGILIVMPWYLKKISVPIVPMLDLIALYAPLLQSVARIGCFFAGCCYGMPTSLPWGFTYTDPNSAAPLYYSLHPTQLYSSASLLLIFLAQYFLLQKIARNPGQLMGIYLMFVSFERFVVDFWRADRVFPAMQSIAFLSIYQILALGIFATGLAILVWTSLVPKKQS